MARKGRIAAPQIGSANDRNVVKAKVGGELEYAEYGRLLTAVVCKKLPLTPI